MPGEMDKDIEFLKRKKLLEYYKEYIRRQIKSLSHKQEEDVYEKVRQLFEEDAYEKLIEIRRDNSKLADTILKNILYLLLNGLINVPVDYVTVEYMRRKIIGESGKIYVFKGGELKELGEKFREDD